MITSRPPRSRTATRWSRSGHARAAVVAAEHQGSYDPGTGSDPDGLPSGSDPSGLPSGTVPSARESAPFGLPVLAELADLAGVLEDLAEADRRQVAAVVALARHVDHGEVERGSGVGVEHWLGIVARATRMDRRLLLRMARLLVRLPGLCQAAEQGLVSFAQLRGLSLALTRLPRELDGRLDTWLADAADRLAQLEADPDALVEQARTAMAELTDRPEDEQAEAEASRRLVLQPRLDGAGGRFYGEEDAYGFAILEAATAPRKDQLDDAGRGRADNLQAFLHHTCDASTNGADDRAHADDGDDAAGRDHADLSGDLDGTIDDADGLAALPASVRARIAAGRDVAAPRMLVRFDLDSLLGHGHAPARILTRLVGGSLRLTSAAARRVVDRAGAEIRAVVVDDGEVVGVGRATRVPPGWLSDAIHAVHDTCTGPLCDRPALGADIDHAVEWDPHDGPGGRTDLDNLGPLCAGTNRDRRATGWEPDQRRRGVRTWRHERSGLRVTSVPSTWRPPGEPPAEASGDPPGDPPGSTGGGGRGEEAPGEGSVPF